MNTRAIEGVKASAPAKSRVTLPFLTRGQQRNGEKSTPNSSPLSNFGVLAKSLFAPNDDALESEADTVADRLQSSPTTQIHRRTTPFIPTPAAMPRSAFSQDLIGRATSGALASPGHPLPAPTRRSMERHLGHDFGRVRVHSGIVANESARKLNAHAYTHGEHIVFNSGAYTPRAANGQRLIAHELTHVVQQRAGHVHRVQRDVIDDVREKMSYGIFDWAITDAEANDSLALLGTIPAADLAEALNRLGTKYVSRLLDNLPDAAKSGEVYERVVSTLGSAGTLDYATEQLSYGLFDWAVTNNDVARVFNIYTNLPAKQREGFLIDLDTAGKLGRLLDNASFGQYTMHLFPWMNGLTRGRLKKPQRSIMRTIVEKAPKNPIDILKLATEIRYDVSIGPTTIRGRTPAPWDGKMLRDTYLALDRLPDAHVARNRLLQRFGQFSQPSKELSTGETAIVAGVYSQGQQELAANVEKEGGIGPSMIHETGHAVDAELGWRTSPEPAKPQRGGWTQYPSRNDCATDMVTDSNGGITTKLDAAKRSDVINDMASAMGNRSASTLTTDIKARPWFAGLPRGDRSEVLDDDALRAIPIGLDSPWFTASEGGEHLADHVYQESYTLTWVRYRHEARTRMVAKYQFRAPGEWFAECYAAYYDPKNKVKGDRLDKKDPDTKTYFDNFVDNRAPSR